MKLKELRYCITFSIGLLLFIPKSNAQFIFQSKLSTSFLSQYGANPINLIEIDTSVYLFSSSTIDYQSLREVSLLHKIDSIGNFTLIKGFNHPDNSLSEFYTDYSQDGYFYSCKYHNFDIVLIKHDLSGDTVWCKKLSRWFLSLNYISELKVRTGGGFYLFGTVEYVTNLSTLLMRFNEQGDTIWTRTIDFAKNPSTTNIYLNKQENYACAPTSDGGIIISGMIKEANFKPRSSWIAKLDSNGVIQWKRKFDYPKSNHIYNIHPLSDGYILTGYCSLTMDTIQNAQYNSEFGVMAIKINLSGDPVWAKMYKSVINGGLPNDHCPTTLASNGDIIFGSVMQTTPFDFITNFRHHALTMLRTDKNGALKWAKKYNINAQDHAPRVVIETSDKSILLASFTRYTDFLPQKWEGFVMKVDSVGKSCSDSIIDPEIIDLLPQMAVSDTITPTVAFYPAPINNFSIGFGGAMSVNYICSGFAPINEPMIKEQYSYLISPNPTEGIIKLVSKHHIVNVKLFSFTGEQVSINTEKIDDEIDIDLSLLSQGIYFIQFLCDNEMVVAKLIKR